LFSSRSAPKLDLVKSNTTRALGGGAEVALKHKSEHAFHNDAPPAGCASRIDLNTPSISGELGGATTFKRTFTAVLGDRGRDGPVRFKFDGDDDKDSHFDIKVSPREFEVSEGQHVSVYITVIPKDDTPMFTPQLGQVSTLSPSPHLHICQLSQIFIHTSYAPCVTTALLIPSHLMLQMHSIRCLLHTACQSALGMPATLPLQVSWRGANGFRGAIPVAVTFRPFVAPRNLPWTADFTDSYKASSASAQKVRLIPTFQRENVLTGTVANDSSIVFSFTVAKPIISKTGMMRLVGSEYGPEVDLDLLLFRKDPGSGDYVVVGQSGNFESNEQIMFFAPGEYKVEVFAYYLPTASTEVTLYQTAIYADGSNNTPGFQLSVSPSELRTNPADLAVARSPPKQLAPTTLLPIQAPMTGEQAGCGGLSLLPACMLVSQSASPWIEWLE
jgi:hypothetical protein